MIPINTNKKLLEKYSVDASIFKMTPAGVYTPTNAREIEKIVRILQPGQSLTARAAGTCMSGGPLTEGLVVSFTEHMHGHSELLKDNLIEVEPGLYHKDLEKYISKKGLMFASYPASKDICAMGGIVNNNSGGEKTLKYGKTEKYVKEISMVCADGHEYSFYSHSGDDLDVLLNPNNSDYYARLHREIYRLCKDNTAIIERNKPRVSKNSAGYYLWDVYDVEKRSLDLSKIIVGAQGTLGIMTKAKIELVPISPYSRMITLYLKDIKSIGMLTKELKKYAPESLELYDDHTFKIAMKYLPSLLLKMNKGQGGVWSLLKLGFSFWKEMKMLITGGIPKIILIAEYTSNDKDKLESDILYIFNNMQNYIGENKIHAAVTLAQSESEAQKYWTFRRESFNLLRSKLKSLRTVPFIEDVVVPADSFPDFMPRFEKILDQHKLLYTIAGHAGDGNLHVIPLMQLKSTPDTELKSISDEVYSLVKEYSGSITGEHNDGLIHAPFLHYMYDEEMLALFEKVKTIFDPKNIFNPHKKIGVKWEDVTKYIDRRI